MNTTHLKLLTIITERILEDRIVKEVVSHGAKGYTLTDSRGKGSRGVRASEWEGPDVKIETVVSADVAERILEHVSKSYFAHHAVIAYVQDVEVVRGGKYV